MYSYSRIGSIERTFSLARSFLELFFFFTQRLSLVIHPKLVVLSKTMWTVYLVFICQVQKLSILFLFHNVTKNNVWFINRNDN